MTRESVTSLAILVPARSGSKRVREKNVRQLGGVTLLERAISTSLKVKNSASVFVSTDSEEYADLARKSGAIVPSLRPSVLAQDSSLDIEWLDFCIKEWSLETEFLAIVRPTSPMLRSRSLEYALERLQTTPEFDSIRAIRQVSEHPGKMWRKVGPEILPLFPQILPVTPTHSRPTQSLERTYVQCGAFEIVRLESVIRHGTIHGQRTLGYELDFPESLDINSELDFRLAEMYLSSEGREAT